MVTSGAGAAPRFALMAAHVRAAQRPRERLAVRARRKTPDWEEPPWAARTFVPYHSQLISAAVQCEAAEEILDRVRLETGVRQGAHERAG